MLLNDKILSFEKASSVMLAMEVRICVDILLSVIRLDAEAT